MMTLQPLADILRAEGLRSTRQRQAVWEEICSTNEHRDVEEIYLALREAGLNVSRATVYRTVEVLVKNNLVNKLDLGDGRIRYEHRQALQHHDHLICLRCGTIEEFTHDTIESLQEEVAREFGFQIIEHRHQLYGYCRDCQGSRDYT